MSDHGVAVGCRKENRKTVSPVPSVLPRLPLEDEEERGEMGAGGALVNVG